MQTHKRVEQNYQKLLRDIVQNNNIPMCSAVMGTAGRDSTTSLDAGGA